MPSLRPKLHHQSPSWVATGATYFLTICAAYRRTAQLSRPEVAHVMLDAARAYHPRRWWCRLWLVMPDHVHGVVVLPRDEALAKVVGDWKRFTTRKLGVEWQANFFDHRIRSHESLEEKCSYIRANPVRAGLVARSADWAWCWETEPMARPIT